MVNKIRPLSGITRHFIGSLTFSCRFLDAVVGTASVCSLRRSEGIHPYPAAAGDLSTIDCPSFVDVSFVWVLLCDISWG